MFKENIYDLPVKAVDPSYFRGNVILQQVLGEGNSKELEIYNVTFKGLDTTPGIYH